MGSPVAGSGDAMTCPAGPGAVVDPVRSGLARVAVLTLAAGAAFVFDAVPVVVEPDVLNAVRIRSVMACVRSIIVFQL